MTHDGLRPLFLKSPCAIGVNERRTAGTSDHVRISLHESWLTKGALAVTLCFAFLAIASGSRANRRLFRAISPVDGNRGGISYLCEYCVWINRYAPQNHLILGRLKQRCSIS
jgi:hypothetical protein